MLKIDFRLRPVLKIASQIRHTKTRERWKFSGRYLWVHDRDKSPPSVVRKRDPLRARGMAECLPREQLDEERSLSPPLPPPPPVIPIPKPPRPSSSKSRSQKEKDEEIEESLQRLKNQGKYVKLNVGGSLHYTTLGTLTKHDNMLRAMFSERIPLQTDDEGEGRRERGKCVMCVCVRERECVRERVHVCVCERQGEI